MDATLFPDRDEEDRVIEFPILLESKFAIQQRIQTQLQSFVRCPTDDSSLISRGP